MIKAIMAVDEEWGVGKNGTLPWPANKEDLLQFKNKTTGHIVIMGSRTWDDPCFPAPLKNRVNVVVTSDSSRFQDGSTLTTNDPIKTIKELEERLPEKDIWIIGGPNLLQQCWDLVQEFHLTIVKGNYSCDKYLEFPQDDFTLIQGDVTPVNTYYIYRRAH
jgi:dihydrofolate reductase